MGTDPKAGGIAATAAAMAMLIAGTAFAQDGRGDDSSTPVRRHSVTRSGRVHGRGGVRYDAPARRGRYDRATVVGVPTVVIPEGRRLPADPGLRDDVVSPDYGGAIRPREPYGFHDPRTDSPNEGALEIPSLEPGLGCYYAPLNGVDHQGPCL